MSKTKATKGVEMDADGVRQSLVGALQVDLVGPKGPLGDPKVVTVTFTTPGNYWAKLTVTDDEGATGSLSLLVIVQ